LSQTYSRFDASKYIEDDQAELVFLEDALESGDPKVIAASIGEIARARGMTQLARDAGVSRESLYRALSADGNPRLDTLMKVLEQLGLRLSVRAARNPESSDAA
jgi:probable addiction module antidote protein